MGQFTLAITSMFRCVEMLFKHHIISQRGSDINQASDRPQVTLFVLHNATSFCLPDVCYSISLLDAKNGDLVMKNCRFSGYTVVYILAWYKGVQDLRSSSLMMSGSLDIDYFLTGTRFNMGRSR